MKPMVKICGITKPKDAQIAVHLGAEFIGLIFVPSSPRKVTLEQAKAVIQEVKGQVKIVGVFQNQSIGDMQSVSTRLDLDYIQLHGEESIIVSQQLSQPLIKRLNPFSSHMHSVSWALGYPEQSRVAYWLIDPPKGAEIMTKDCIGQELMTWVKQTQIPYFIAGRLTPENVGEAIERFRPQGVDVASGVEMRPGLKDSERMQRFFDAVQKASAYIGEH